MAKSADSSIFFTKTQSGSSGSTILQSLPADMLQDWVVRLLKKGAAVTIAQTKDGAKLSITVLYQGKADKTYFEEEQVFVSQVETVLLTSSED